MLSLFGLFEVSPEQLRKQALKLENERHRPGIKQDEKDNLRLKSLAVQSKAKEQANRQKSKDAEENTVYGKIKANKLPTDYRQKNPIRSFISDKLGGYKKSYYDEKANSEKQRVKTIGKLSGEHTIAVARNDDIKKSDIKNQAKQISGFDNTKRNIAIGAGGLTGAGVGAMMLRKLLKNHEATEAAKKAATEAAQKVATGG